MKVSSYSFNNCDTRAKSITCATSAKSITCATSAKSITCATRATSITPKWKSTNHGQNKRVGVVTTASKRSNDSSADFRNKYRDELKNLVKKLQNRKIDQVQEIQATQSKIYDDFKDFHVATLKIFQEEIQDRIDNVDKKNKNKDNDITTTTVEVIDGIEMNEDLSRSDSG